MNAGVFEGQSCNHQNLMGLWKINQGPLQTASSATIKMKGHAPFMLFCLGSDNHKETQNVQRPHQASSKGFHDQTRKADLHQAAAWPTFMKVNANPEKVSRNTCAEKGRSIKNQNEC